MKITQASVEEKFRDFNARYFGGTLPVVPIRLVESRSTLGRFAYTRARSLWGRMKIKNPSISISTLYDIDEPTLEATLLHEMIHYYILHHRIPDSSSHGLAFRKMMNDLRERTGLDIKVSHKASLSVAPDAAPRARFIFVCTLEDGRQGFAIVARTRLFEFDDAISQHYQLKDKRWYGSADPFFSRFAVIRTPKLYLVKGTELEQHLQGAVPLVREGNKIHPA